MKYEDGFHFNEYPCASGKPDALIIFLHGHGNHPDMFAQVPEEIQKRYPNADVLVVRGPVAINADPGRKTRHGVEQNDDLYTWYHSAAKPEDTLDLAISHLFNRVPVVDDLNKFADAQLKKRNLEDKNLFLFGFSLGGAISVQMATKRPNEIAGVICHSGPVLPIMAPKSKPDMLLLMGDQDPLFYTKSKIVQNPNPPKRGKLSRALDRAMEKISVHYNASLMRLKKAGINAKGVVIAGMSHTINEASFLESIAFLTEKLGKNAPPAAPQAPQAPQAPKPPPP